MKPLASIVLCAFAAAAGCHGAGSSPPPTSAGAAPDFELHCGAPTTSNASQLRCVRVDTRTGDVLVVDQMKLPVSNGPTASAADAPGTYTAACAATSMPNRADFFCLRLNTRTGDLLMINLPKVGTLPAGQPEKQSVVRLAT